VSSSTSFGVNDMYFTTSVTMENTGDNTLFDVQYMRNVDPDQEEVRGPGVWGLARGRGLLSLLLLLLLRFLWSALQRTSTNERVSKAMKEVQH
jgi:hypothetical protein